MEIIYLVYTNDAFEPALVGVATDIDHAEELADEHYRKHGEQDYLFQYCSINYALLKQIPTYEYYRAEK